MPTGNPQNLFLYYSYKYDLISFLSAALPIVLCGGIMIMLGFLFIKKDKFDLILSEEKIKNPLHVIIYFILFMLLFSVFKIIPFYIPFIVTVITVFILDKFLFKEADYLLLATFLCFFVLLEI